METTWTPDAVDLDRLADTLDQMTDEARVAAVRGMGARLQARLWDLAAGRATSLDDFVPPEVAPATQVIHAGRNSLPIFNVFEKRFCRVEGRDDALYGYNEGSTRPLIGPGYFVARFFPERGEVGIDYFQVPPADARLPEGWPSIKPNESGLQRFVFARMVDYMRKVSRHVTIGRAVRQGKETNNYFLLCRTGV